VLAVWDMTVQDSSAVAEQCGGRMVLGGQQGERHAGGTACSCHVAHKGDG
jgi:hypothetical protein